MPKAELPDLQTDIQKTSDSNQMCADQMSGVMAADRAIHNSFHSENCEGTLLIDAATAFNCLNCGFCS